MHKIAYRIKYRPASMPAVRDNGKEENRSWVIEIAGWREEALEAAKAAWDALDAAGHVMISMRPGHYAAWSLQCADKAEELFQVVVLTDGSRVAV